MVKLSHYLPVILAFIPFKYLISSVYICNNHFFLHLLPLYAKLLSIKVSPIQQLAYDTKIPTVFHSSHSHFPCPFMNILLFALPLSRQCGSKWTFSWTDESFKPGYGKQARWIQHSLIMFKMQVLNASGILTSGFFSKKCLEKSLEVHFNCFFFFFSNYSIKCVWILFLYYNIW